MAQLFKKPHPKNKSDPWPCILIGTQKMNIFNQFNLLTESGPSAFSVCSARPKRFAATHAVHNGHYEDTRHFMFNNMELNQII